MTTIGRRDFSDSPTLRWLVAGSVQRPKEVLLAWACATALATWGVARVEIETTGASLLHKSDPAWAFYEDSVDRFGGDKIVVLALEGNRPFDPEVIERLGAWSRAAEGISGVRRVDSIHTFPIVRASRDGSLLLDPAIEAAGVAPQPEVIREILERDRVAKRTLLSDDETVFAVNVLLDDVPARQEAGIVRELERLMDGRGWISGVPIYETHIGPRTQREILAFVPLTILLVGTVLFVFFRSWVAVLIPLATSGLGVWLLVGLMGMLGEPITITGMLLPSVLLALGCAYVMHVLVAARGAEISEDLVAGVQRVAPAVALSGLTTAIGFFAIATVRIDAIRALGAYGGIGVLFVLAASLTAAPAALRLLPLRRRHGGATSTLETYGPARLAELAARGRPVILAAWTLVALASAMGLPRVTIETDAVLWWPHGTKIRDAYEEIRSRLSGISPVNVVIEASGDRSAVAPEMLSILDAFSTHLEGIPHVGKVVSVADPLRQLHGEFLDDPSDPLPGTPALIAQYLLLLESVDHLRDLLSDDHRSANLVLRVDNNGSEHLLAVARAAEEWWRREGPPDFSARATGIMYEFARAEDEIAWGQVRGLTLAFGAVGLVLLVAFRTARVAVLVMIPNLVPLVVIYGLMGWLRLPIDAGTICLGSLALGIAVDDSIHIAATYLRMARQRGPGRKAMAESLAAVLPAVVMTSAAVAIGFAVLGFSQFALTRNLGLIVAFLVSVCLIADTTLLPSLLLGRGEGSPRLADSPRVAPEHGISRLKKGA